ncbi:hypothetical protein [Roseicella aquatilis]|uniref:Uncharacterized protein n=1 Tax=Roseicella aquatilis TaxID=2527868 RepID=A0A4R4D2B1_9PROT|nr:hypothetical protein [Roseicella aquatilis]TCZ52620.1 hypothetical protein EXY23_26195 [Roseicella aquatilis]
MWDWTMDGDLLLLAATIALCGLVPAAMARGWLAREGGPVAGAMTGLSPALHAAVSGQVRQRLESLALQPRHPAAPVWPEGGQAWSGPIGSSR